MTHTTLISEHALFAAISGKFSGTPQDSRAALMNLLKAHDPYFPVTTMLGHLSVVWYLSETYSSVEAYYVNMYKSGPHHNMGHLGRDAMAVAATITTTAGVKHAPTLHGDISLPALRAYAEASSPLHATIESYFASMSALEEAKPPRSVLKSARPRIAERKIRR